MLTMPDAARLADELKSGRRRALARAITLIESTHVQHRLIANELLREIMPATGRSIRIGISGVPGVGKSTFIEAFGKHVIELGNRVAVLAVDPSSAVSGGSILGDKTRMEELARNRDAFIRPSPAGGTLGGVGRRTRETTLLCEAADYNVIIIETVGVGQSETAVADMTDMFMLLLLPGGGDELQGIKRGIVELADMIIVNKADGDLEPAARRAATEYQSALRFLRPRVASWQVPVRTCSSLEDRGVAEIWNTVIKFRNTLADSGEFSARRARQARSWMWSETAESLVKELKSHPLVRTRIGELESAVADGVLPASVAAEELVSIFKEQS